MSGQLQARLTAWRATGDPATLWPDVPREALSAAHRVIFRAASTVLSGAGRPALEAPTPRAIGVAAHASGMGPLLGYWVEQRQIDAPAPVAAILAVHLDHGRRRAAKLSGELIRITRALNLEGVRPTLLKAAHTAQRYFPDPGTRPAGDIDLLVRPTDVDPARRALREAGLRESPHHEVTASRLHWVPGEASHAVRSLEFEHVDNPWSLDLHVSLDRRYFRGRRAGFGEAVHERTDPWGLGGAQARLLAQPLLTGFLAQHASSHLDMPRLVNIVELVIVIRSDVASGYLDWGHVADLVSDTDMNRFVYPALELAERLVPTTVNHAVLATARAEAPAAMRRVVDAVAAGGVARFRPRTLDDRIMWSKGPMETLTNWSDVVWPTINPNSPITRWQAYHRRWRMLVRGRIGLRARGTR